MVVEVVWWREGGGEGDAGVGMRSHLALAGQTSVGKDRVEALGDLGLNRPRPLGVVALQMAVGCDGVERAQRRRSQRRRVAAGGRRVSDGCSLLLFVVLIRCVSPGRWAREGWSCMARMVARPLLTPHLARSAMSLRWCRWTEGQTR